jgi:hypothetical protein
MRTWTKISGEAAVEVAGLCSASCLGTCEIKC